MKTERITCDGCGDELTVETKASNTRLVLQAEHRAEDADLPGDPLIRWAFPLPLTEGRHFCDLDCLVHWCGRERHYLGAWREYLVRWDAEHPNSKFYPTGPSFEERQRRHAEFEAAALAAFPMGRQT